MDLHPLNDNNTKKALEWFLKANKGMKYLKNMEVEGE